MSRQLFSTLDVGQTFVIKTPKNELKGAVKVSKFLYAYTSDLYAYNSDRQPGEIIEIGVSSE